MTTAEQNRPCRKCGHKLIEHNFYLGQQDEDHHCFLKQQCGCNQFLY